MENLNSLNFEKSRCIHTKNIISLVDLVPTDDRYLELSQHLKSCSHCQKAYKHFEQQMIAAQVFIPRPIMDHELKETFDREMHELLISLGLNKKVARKNKVKGLIKKTNIFSEELLKTLFRPSMLLSYCLAGVLYYFLK